MHWLWISIYVAAVAGSNLCFRQAACGISGSLFWWLWFGVGNLAGFLAPVSITLALKETSAPWLFGIAIGGGFVLLQGLGVLIFGDRLTTIQIFGIAMIGIGIAFLSWKT